ncbi:MAG: dienelactone hydrolase family protein [Limnohabitans sp.]|nr:dienelactone hydrolase family protein [Limnohabitans sp.]
MGQIVQLRASDGFQCPAYMASPKNTPRGAIVVLQEIFGVNSHIKAVADGYALAGYLAIAPQTFARAQLDVNLGYTSDDMNAGFALKTKIEGLPAPGIIADIQAAVDLGRFSTKGKVGMVGYCWGGLLTWKSAEVVNGLSAAVPYYGGGVTTEAEMKRKPQCPVQAHFGKKDHWIPMDTVEAFKKAYSQVEVHSYEADHGFNCDQRGSYDETAANEALVRALAFFSKHVG